MDSRKQVEADPPATTAGVASSGPPARIRGLPPLRGSWRQLAIPAVLVVLVVVFSVLSPAFFSVSNLTNVALQSAINAILAIGMTYVIITGGIDLSVGSIVALSSVIAADVMAGGTAFPVAVAVGLAVGAACGMVNAALVVYGRIAPFIATLGTLSVFRGAALLYTEGQPILGVPREFRIALAGQTFGIPAPVILAGVVAIAAYVVLRHTRLGEHALALGGNPEAARLSGVNIGRVKGSVYVISGLLSALAGLVLVARLGAAEPISAQGAELNAIAAAVMGGASLAGGRGSILGTVIGALIIATLTAGLTILNVQAFYQLIAIGTVIILAVLADRAEASRA